jgi:hypothetical protein
MPRQGGQAADGWQASHCAVGSVVIAEVQPAGRAPRRAVSESHSQVQAPPAGEGAVEPPDFPVGPGPVRAGPLVSDPQPCDPSQLLHRAAFRWSSGLAKNELTCENRHVRKVRVPPRTLPITPYLSVCSRNSSGLMVTSAGVCVARAGR